MAGKMSDDARLEQALEAAREALCARGFDENTIAHLVHGLVLEIVTPGYLDGLLAETGEAWEALALWDGYGEPPEAARELVDTTREVAKSLLAAAQAQIGDAPGFLAAKARAFLVWKDR